MCVVSSLLGQRVAVIVNHLASRLGGQEKSEPNRIHAAELSKAIAIDSLWRVDPDMGVIIMGDLNDDPMDKSCAKTLGAKKKADGVGSTQILQPLVGILDKGIARWHIRASGIFFDQIIISRATSSTPTAAEGMDLL